jgi:hypothetical protein
LHGVNVYERVDLPCNHGLAASLQMIVPALQTAAFVKFD